jgi:hypothetical protein
MEERVLQALRASTQGLQPGAAYFLESRTWKPLGVSIEAVYRACDGPVLEVVSIDDPCHPACRLQGVTPDRCRAVFCKENVRAGTILCDYAHGGVVRRAEGHLTTSPFAYGFNVPVGRSSCYKIEVVGMPQRCKGCCINDPRNSATTMCHLEEGGTCAGCSVFHGRSSNTRPRVVVTLPADGPRIHVLLIATKDIAAVDDASRWMEEEEGEGRAISRWSRHAIRNEVLVNYGGCYLADTIRINVDRELRQEAIACAALDGAIASACASLPRQADGRASPADARRAWGGAFVGCANRASEWSQVHEAVREAVAFVAGDTELFVVNRVSALLHEASGEIALILALNALTRPDSAVYQTLHDHVWMDGLDDYNVVRAALAVGRRMLSHGADLRAASVGAVMGLLREIAKNLACIAGTWKRSPPAKRARVR